MMIKVEKDLGEGFYLQFIYDDEPIKFPWCNNNGYLCPMDDFITYAIENVILDYDFVDKFCKAEAGIDYISMKKPDRSGKVNPDL